MTTIEINERLSLFKKFENNFLKQLHGRFIMDCKYYFGEGNKCSKHLWANDEFCMVEIMKGLSSILDSRNISYDKEEWEYYIERLLPNNFYNLFDYFKYTKTGFICKASEQALSNLETQNLMVSLIWENGLDFTLAGEDGCISNFDMYTPLYSYYTNLVYIIPHSVAENWKKGDIIEICNGREPTQEELDFIS